MCHQMSLLPLIPTSLIVLRIFLLTLEDESLIIDDFNNHFTDRPHEPRPILLAGFIGNNFLSQFNGVSSSPSSAF